PAPPQAVSVQVDVSALSHPGYVRTNNEDAYLVARLSRALETLFSNLPEGDVPHRVEEAGYALFVADGLGGMPAGEVASRRAASTLVNLVLETPDWIMRTGEREREQLAQRIAQRCRLIDAALTEEGQRDPSRAGMSTTMTLAFNVGRELFIGHVGDSRAYL